MENLSTIEIKEEIETDDWSQIPTSSLNSDPCCSQSSSGVNAAVSMSLTAESCRVNSINGIEAFNGVRSANKRSFSSGVGQSSSSNCAQNDPGLQKVQQFIKMVDDTLLEESRDMGIDIARLLLSAQQKIIAKLLENSSFSKQTREVSSQTDFFPTKPLEQASIVDAHFQSNFTLGSKQVRTISEPLRNGGQSSPGGVRGNLLSCDAPGVVPAPISPSQKQTINAVSSFTPGTSDVTATLAAQPRPQFASNLASSLNLAASQNLVDHHANQRLNRGVKEIGGTEKILKRQQLRELQQFAAQFRERRIRLGFTQADVGKSLGSVLGTDFFSQTTISRFEALNLSLRNMLKLRPTLELWIENMTQKHCESSSSPSVINPGASNPTTFSLSSSVSSSSALVCDFSNPVSMRKKRKRRCHIDQSLKMNLEVQFDRNAHPSPYQLRLLSEEMNLDVDTLKTWFSNRRSKFRKEKVQHVSSFVMQDIQKSAAL